MAGYRLCLSGLDGIPQCCQHDGLPGGTIQESKQLEPKQVWQERVARVEKESSSLHLLDLEYILEFVFSTASYLRKYNIQVSWRDVPWFIESRILHTGLNEFFPKHHQTEHQSHSPTPLFSPSWLRSWCWQQQSHKPTITNNNTTNQQEWIC